MKIFLSLLVGVTLIAFNVDQTVPRHNVFFAYNSSDLNGSPARVVESVYHKLGAGKQIRFGIVGPISNVHNTAEKNRITAERANNILALLKSIGSEEDSLSIQDVTNPYQPKPMDVAANKPFVLEVLLTKAVGWVEPKFTSIDEFLPIPVQSFSIDPREDNRLVGEHGTVINIPANTLQLRNGSVPAQMTVELKEVYGGGTIVNADLHTNSGGKMLETGGTIHLDAHTNGSKARIAYGEEIDLEFPGAEKEKTEDMQLFKGGFDRSGNFDWKPRRRIQQRTSRSQYYINDQLVTKAVYDSTKAAWLAEQAEMERRIAEAQARQKQREEERKIYEANRKKMDANMQASNANSEAMDAYLMSTDELGWINCDRFLEEERPLTEVIVMVDTTYRPSVKLVFDNIKSVMPGEYNPMRGTVTFRNIPINETVRLVGYSIMDDVPYMANSTLTISNGMKTDLKLNKTTKPQMQGELASLN
jgi:hypothetical protein